MNRAKYLWLDLETTGLDVESDDILEIAVRAGSPDFMFVDEGLSLVLTYPFDPVELQVDQFVVDMHTKNGLWAECAESGVTDASAERQVVEYVRQFEWVGEKPILAGSSVASFDLKFIRYDMPALAALLHHRCFDVSTLKMACEDVVPGATYEKIGTHRAMADIIESLNHGRRAVELLRRPGA